MGNSSCFQSKGDSPLNNTDVDRIIKKMFPTDSLDSIVDSHCSLLFSYNSLNNYSGNLFARFIGSQSPDVSTSEQLNLSQFTLNSTPSDFSLNFYTMCFRLLRSKTGKPSSHL